MVRETWNDAALRTVEAIDALRYCRTPEMERLASQLRKCADCTDRCPGIRECAARRLSEQPAAQDA